MTRKRKPAPVPATPAPPPTPLMEDKELRTFVVEIADKRIKEALEAIPLHLEKIAEDVRRDMTMYSDENYARRIACISNTIAWGIANLNSNLTKAIHSLEEMEAIARASIK